MAVIACGGSEGEAIDATGDGGMTGPDADPSSFATLSGTVWVPGNGPGMVPAGEEIPVFDAVVYLSSGYASCGSSRLNRAPWPGCPRRSFCRPYASGLGVAVHGGSDIGVAQRCGNGMPSSASVERQRTQGPPHAMCRNLVDLG